MATDKGELVLTSVHDEIQDGTRPLTEIVADAIVNAVAQGILKPGQRLIEVDLATQLKVSRVPVREAIKILQAQGIVKAVPNQGVRIALFDSLVVDQIVEARIALEKIAAQHALCVYTKEPRRIEKLNEIVMRMESAAKWLDWAELRKLDLAFHHEFCRASGNEIVLSLWEALARHITIIFGRELENEQNFPLVIAQHQKLIQIFQGTKSNLDDEIQAHITRLVNKTKNKLKPKQVKK